MMARFQMNDLLTLPNLLTCFRFVSAPVLLLLAWLGNGRLFLMLLAITFLTDVLDGMAARMLNLESDLGALLDSWGDLLIYTTLAISAWWLWPELVRRESVYVMAVVISYMLPVAVGLLKFRAFTSYHTWLVKVAVAMTGCGFFLLVLFDIASLFRWAAMMCLLAASEEIVITGLLQELRSNVKSFWHVKREMSRID